MYSNTDITNTDWVSEFAPRSQSKFLSYVVGWLAALGWQALVATTGELELFRTIQVLY